MGKYSLSKIHKVISTTNFTTDNKSYILAKIDKSDYENLLTELSKINEEFIEIINDKNELSLIVPNEIWETHLEGKFRLVEKMSNLALITCEVEQETVTGYLLAIITILSPHNISVFVQAAYTTDHIFVEKDKLAEALNLLNQLKND